MSARLHIDYADKGEILLHKYLEYVGPNDTNATGKSNKFWEIAAVRLSANVYAVVRRWGKYGKKGQSKENLVYGRYEAKKSARKLYTQKRDKGYTKEIDIVTRLGAVVK